MPLQAEPGAFVPSLLMSDACVICCAMPSNAEPQSDCEMRPATDLRPAMSSAVSMTPAIVPFAASFAVVWSNVMTAWLTVSVRGTPWNTRLILT